MDNKYRRYIVNGDSEVIQYKPINSLSFNGSEYIDTGLYPMYTWEFHLTVKITTTGVTNFLFGSRTAASSTNTLSNTLLFNASNYLRRDNYGKTATSTSTLTSTTAFRDCYVRRHFVQVCSAANMVSAKTDSVSTGTCTYPLYIGNVNTSGTAGIGLHGTIFNFTIYNEKLVMVLNCIPVEDKNGVQCMFDTVSGKLLYKQTS